MSLENFENAYRHNTFVQSHPFSISNDSNTHVSSCTSAVFHASNQITGDLLFCILRKLADGLGELG
jgi:hypothetical protein